MIVRDFDPANPPPTPILLGSSERLQLRVRARVRVVDLHSGLRAVGLESLLDTQRTYTARVRAIDVEAATEIVERLLGRSAHRVLSLTVEPAKRSPTSADARRVHHIKSSAPLEQIPLVSAAELLTEARRR